MSARDHAGPARAPSESAPARAVLRLKFPAPSEPVPPEFDELLDRIDRLETRQSRRPGKERR